MILKKFDLYFSFFLLLIATFCSYKLFFDQFRAISQNPNDLIATISKQFNTVKLKRSGQLAWIDALINTQLERNDQIYTHEGSSTELLLKDRSTVHIFEKTLFKIGKTDQNTEFFIEKGSIQTQFTKSSQEKIKLYLGKQSLELNADKATIAVTKESDRAKISIIEGQVQIKQNDTLTTVGDNHYIEINQDKPNNQIEIKKESIILVKPQVNQVEYFNDEKNITFSFKSLVADASQFVVEVSNDTNFTTLYASTQTSESSARILMRNEGVFYWRIRGHGIDSSPVGQFQLIKVKPPAILSPEPGQSLLFEKISAEENNTLQIILEQFIHEAEIEMVLPDLTKKTFLLDENILEIPVLMTGTYAIRSRNIVNKTEISNWGEEIKFSINQAGLPFAPEIVFPNHNHEFIFYNRNKMNVDLHWKSPESIPTQYDLIIRDSKDNTELINLQTISNVHHQKISRPGKYNWQVRMHDKWQRLGPFSKENSFNITLIEIKNTLPQDGVILKLARPDQKVQFEWEKNNSESESIFEVSRESNFDEIIHAKETSKNKIEMVFKETGTFFWRIKNKDNSENISEYAEPIRVIIEPTAPPLKPVLPKFKEFKIQLKESSSIQNIFDFFIPSASAADYFTKIEWPSKENIKSYKIEIYQDSKMENLILSKTVSTNYFEWDNPPMGTFYWRMALIDYWDRMSEFSDLSTILIDMENNLKISQEISLITPKHSTEEDYLKNKIIEFSWEKIESAKEYEILFSHDLDFSNPFLSFKTKKNSITLEHNKLKQGQIYWKVSARLPYEASANSKRRSLKLLAGEAKTKIESDQKNDEIVKILRPRNEWYWGYAYSKDNYEITSPNFQSNIDDATVASLFSQSMIHLSPQYTFEASFFIKKGKVYNDQNWQVIDLLPSINYSLASEYQHLIQLGLGAGINQTGVYPYTTGSLKPSYKSKMFLSPFLSAKYSPHLTNKTQFAITINKAFTGTSFLMFGADLKYQYTQRSLLLLGINYMKKSFEYENQDVQFSELRVMTGLGFIF